MDNCDRCPDSSDSSDEDYVPDSKIEDAVSEVESDGDPEEQLSGSDSETNKNKKRTKKPKKKAKLPRKAPSPSPEKSTAEPTNNPEEQKKKADDLWADFMKDTGFKSKGSGNKTTISDNSSKSSTSSKAGSAEKNQDTSQKPPAKVKVTQIFEFAGEEVKVEKEVNVNSAEARLLAKETSQSTAPKRGAGLSGIGNVLSQLAKKQKISTLEKTKLDWDRFKKEQNIDEELQTHNKGKDGYLERQDFLERADLRRFEIEREIRNVERAKRFNSTL
ncbi:craniofacial development protein 1 [Dendroctonus ponderosae]|uniref:Craniofacial development protein 1 n=1 Tax=Dendroctonus ponderosae TaxID=77166 RepID=U4UM71_DENPD|nr:craniofacial development protein 1 [Dendroctonus ponderosae]ERL95174.1 hypothetical protein D910_12443 [Dendroctonus ponderosae]KAH1018740.1 hypothetical protein HUJ05_006452 [Dendroctonus ponderosae]